MTISLARLWRALRALTGDLDHERHLERCRRTGRPPLSPAGLYLERLERRYRSTARCC